MRRLNSPMTCYRISAGIDSMISLTCSMAGMTVTVTKERYVEMLHNIFPEDSPDISSESVCVEDAKLCSASLENSVVAFETVL